MPHTYAISEKACWPWLGCHGDWGTRLNGSVCGCIWDDCRVRSTAQAIQPSSSHGVFLSNHLCQQTSQSVSTAAADAWGAVTEYKWRLNNEVGWCCLTRWLLKSGYNFRRICLHRLCSFFTQIWFGFKSWSLGLRCFHFAKDEIWYFFSDIVVNIQSITFLFLS